MRWIVAAAAAGALLAGCTSGSGPASGAYPTYSAGNHTVAVVPYERLGSLADSLDAYVDTTDIIASAKVVAVNDVAYEVKPDPNAEGASKDEGPDIFGTVTFELVTVYKGQASLGDRLTTVFESGKWNRPDKKLRLAYKHERFALLQTERAALKAPEELAGLTFLLFARPAKTGVMSQRSDAALRDIATLAPSGVVQFGGEAPFLRPSGAGAIKIDDVVVATR